MKSSTHKQAWEFTSGMIPVFLKRLLISLTSNLEASAIVFLTVILLFGPGKVPAQDTLQRQSIHQLQHAQHDTGEYIRKPVEVRPGIEVLFDECLDELTGKSVGLVVNHTAVDKDGMHLVDRLLRNDIHIGAIFAPEHGYRGDAAAGQHIENGIDPVSGAQVYSLYGEARKPSDEMMDHLDVLIYDIQDVGVRFYTYISTLGYAMQAAARNDVEFWILDRPNPLGGERVAGPILEKGYMSFVGLYPIPVQYGLTVGELGRMIAGEDWLDYPPEFQPRVIRMVNWRRDLWYDETDVPWMAPSPNMPTLKTAAVYPGTCFIEGTNISEGRGTSHPFEWIGAPWIEGNTLSRRLNDFSLPGVVFEPVTFTPVAISGKALRPKYQEEPCGGVRLVVTDRTDFKAVRTGVYILWAIHKLYPDSFGWRDAAIDRLYGSDALRKSIDSGASAREIIDGWKQDIKSFLSVRKKYLIY